MKKLYSLVMLALISVIGFAAKAATVDCTIVVDVAERVSVQTMSGGFINMPQTVQLVDGENQVQVNAEQLLNIIANTGYEVTSVTINGEEQVITDPSYVSIYFLSKYEGATVTITTAESGTDPGTGDVEEPVIEMCKVSFEFADEASKEYIQAVTIQGDPVENPFDGFEVDKGKYVELQLNTALTTDEFTVNGEAPFVIVGSANIEIVENTVIYVKVHQDVVYNFSIIIDNAENAEAGYWKTIGSGWTAQSVFQTFELKNGMNLLSVSEKDTKTVSVRGKGEGRAVESIKVNGTDVEVADETVIDLEQDLVIEITTKRTEPDAHCLFVCDDYTKVSLTVGGRAIELTSGEQTIDFFSDSESTFTIKTVNYYDKIYSVTLNGEAVEAIFGNYTINDVKDNDKIEVVTIAPDVTVTFTYADELSKQLVDRITVLTDANGTVEADNFETLTVPVGSYISVYTNKDMIAEEFTVTGSELLTYPNSYEFSVAGETNVYIKAVEKEKTKININVDNAELVKVYYSVVSYNILGIPVIKEVVIELNDGDNVITFDDAPEKIKVEAVGEATIDSITVDGTEYEAGAEIPVVKDMNVVIKSHDETLAISSVLSGNATANVYNLQGMQVLKGADAAQLRQLPAGIYVINNKKVMIK